MTDAERCPDCDGTKQGCGCEDCEYVGACVACCHPAARQALYDERYTERQTPETERVRLAFECLKRAADGAKAQT